MKYGSYLLNPGDLFQVDPDKVMYASGKDKNMVEFEARARLNREIGRLRDQAMAEGREFDESAAVAPTTAADDALSDLAELPEEDRAKEQRTRLSALIRSAKNLISADRGLSANRKKELRSFMARCKVVLKDEGKKKGDNKSSPSQLVKILASLSNFKVDETSQKVVPKTAEDQEAAAAAKDQEAAAAAKDEGATGTEKEGEDHNLILTSRETYRLAQIIRAQELEDEENPVDPSKPYATPWEPRKWLRPFAFIPRYLEVNQSICAAVYFRHPVARKGLAEVPTPFPYDVGQLAYAWYLRRR
jgi:hypothetical protein